MPYDKSAITNLLSGLSPKDRCVFHNPLVSFLAFAGNAMRLPTAEEVVDIVKTSRSLSPKTEPTAWLKMVHDTWGKAPMLCPRSYAVTDILKGVESQSTATRTKVDRELQHAFASGDYSAGLVPQFACVVMDDREVASKLVQRYQENYNPSAGAVLPLGGEHDGQYLALAYANEDVTTSHVFQGLKMMGFKLDEQAEAQIRGFDQYMRGELPESLGVVASRLCADIPFNGVGTPLPDLMPLHTQPHRYDQEALTLAQQEGISPD